MTSSTHLVYNKLPVERQGVRNQGIDSMTYKLYKHQEDFLKIVKDHSNYLLSAECGTGKTIMLIQHIRYLYNQRGLSKPTLIVCPNIVTENWHREIGKFASQKMYDSTTILKGTRDQRIKRLKDQGKCIFIINYEGLSVIKEELLAIDWGIVICDEIHRAKNPKAVSSKIVVDLSKKAEYRYGATGTPIANTMLDIFNIFMFLDHGNLFGRNFFGFRAKYFQDKNAMFKHKEWYFPKWEVRPNALNEIQTLLASKNFRVLKEDCLDLPPKVYKQVYVDMTSEQQKHYDNIKKELITEFNQGVVVAANALTKVQRLSQITSGLLFNTDQEVHEINCAKMTALKELIDQLNGDKVIIWGVFRKELERINEFCINQKLNPVLIYGGVKDTSALAEKFDTDPECKVLICQIHSGIGFNATAAKYAIYFNNSYSIIDRLQSEDRCHRVGSEKHSSITYIDIVTTNSIDEIVLGALKGKKDLASAVLDSLKE